MQEHCALHKSWQILSSTFQGPHRAGMLLGIICTSALVFPALGAPGLAPLSQTTRDLTSPPLPWGIWFHSAATGFRFLFLGRQGQLGMWLSSCLGFPLTSVSSGRIWGAWSPLMMLLSPRTESAMAGTGAERPWFHFAGKGERPARRAQKSQIWGKTTEWDERLRGGTQSWQVLNPFRVTSQWWSSNEIILWRSPWHEELYSRGAALGGVRNTALNAQRLQWAPISPTGVGSYSCVSLGHSARQDGHQRIWERGCAGKSVATFLTCSVFLSN